MARCQVVIQAAGDSGSPQRGTAWVQSRLSCCVMLGLELNPPGLSLPDHKASEMGLKESGLCAGRGWSRGGCGGVAGTHLPPARHSSGDPGCPPWEPRSPCVDHAGYGQCEVMTPTNPRHPEPRVEPALHPAPQGSCRRRTQERRALTPAPVPCTHVIEMLRGLHDVRGPFVLLQFHPALSEELPVGSEETRGP